MASPSVATTTLIQRPIKNTLEISEKEFNELVAFMNGRTFKAQRHRVAEYFKSDVYGDLAFRIFLGSLGTVTTTATTGLFIGAAVGGPKGAIIGLATGVGAGLVIVAISSCMTHRKQYIAWKKNICNEKIILVFERFHREHPLLKEFIDPISKSILIDPVITSCGHTFERNPLEEWIEKNKDKAKCPFCSKKITKDTLTVDLITLGKMKRVYSKLALENFDNVKDGSELNLALKVLNKDLEKQAEEVLKRTSCELSFALSSNKITVETYVRQIQELIELYPEYKKKVESSKKEEIEDDKNESLELNSFHKIDE